jgi:hypothetical protein
MEKCGIKDNVYKFPSSSDIDDVEAKYVFHADFAVENSSGRLWSLSDSAELKSRFKQYIHQYC